MLMTSGILLGLLAQVKAGSYTYITIDEPGSTSTELRGINNAGQIVGESSLHSFLLSNGSFTPIAVPVAKIFTRVFGINDIGQIVGYYQQEISPQNRLHGFVLSGGIYTTLDVPAQTVTAATGINNAGQVVGTTYTPFSGGTTHGFLYSGGSYTTFDMPGAMFGTGAHGINSGCGSQ
jgi:probable HAF family extracellular repeat protein